MKRYIREVRRKGRRRVVGYRRIPRTGMRSVIGAAVTGLVPACVGVTVTRGLSFIKN